VAFSEALRLLIDADTQGGGEIAPERAICIGGRLEEAPSEEVGMLTTKPRVRISGRGNHLRVRLKGDWKADPVSGLRESCRSSVAIEKAVAEAMLLSHAAGVSWDEIGRTLGVAEDAADKESLIDAFADSRRGILKHLLRNVS
jgi:hypothetical protein